MTGMTLLEERTGLKGRVSYLVSLTDYPIASMAWEELFKVDDFVPFRSTYYELQVSSLDLKSLMVHSSFGLTVGLEPAKPGSFFTPSVDDDSSYKLYCNCGARLLLQASVKTGYGQCRKCGEGSPYLHGRVSNVWLPPSGVQLTIDKAVVREDRAAGKFFVPEAHKVREEINKLDFTEKLVQWVEPWASDPLKAHAIAWDLTDSLEQIWVAWKKANRWRDPLKKLASYRTLQEIWGDSTSNSETFLGSKVLLTSKQYEKLAGG